jgi:hypothetical protein
VIRVDDKAIGIGAAIGVAVGLLANTVGQALVAMTPDASVALLIVAQRALGMLSKIAGGFAAGWIARRDGALHGAIVGAVIAAVGLGIGIAMTVARGMGHVYSEGGLALWTQIAGWSIVGIGVAAVSAIVAVRLRN